MTTAEHGLVIAIDGPDGVGKSEQVKRLVAYFEAKGRTVHATRSSGGTPIGEELRKVSLGPHERPAETDLFISLAMGAALAKDIEKRKAAGEVIIIDRSPLAIVAYNGYGSELESKKLAFDACEALFRKCRIDQLVFLEAPVSVLQVRRLKRGEKDYFEAKGKDFHDRVTEGYKAGMEYLKSHQDIGVQLLPVKSSASIEKVHSAIVKALTSMAA